MQIYNKIAKLDTLAQVGKSPKILLQKSTKQSYQKRAKAKAISNEMCLKLADCNSPLKKGYFNTFYCSSVILQDGNKATSKYCKNRWCLVCNRIRSANMIHGYKQPLAELSELRFITLTIPAIKSHEIKSSIQSMQKYFEQIRDVLRKTHKIKLNGLRKIECNYNKEMNTYNPHFHCLFSLTELQSDLFVNLWLERYQGTDRKAQDITKADCNTLPELFKYFTKMLTKGRFEAEAQNNIFIAFKGIRTVQSYGIKKVVCEDIEELKSQEIDFKDDQSEIWVWEPGVFDWVSSQGETWCDYTPTLTTMELIDNIRKPPK